MLRFFKTCWKSGGARPYLLLLLGAVSAGLVGFSVWLYAQGEDTDQDGMSDAYENFFGLDPTNAADASLNYDSDDLNNLAESGLLTDPFVADSDRDGFNDGADSNAISRAYLKFGDPKFTSGDDYSYCAPDWLLRVYRIAGDWLTNPVCWHVPASESNNVGSLNVDLSRSSLTNNLRWLLSYWDYAGAALHLDLLDTNADVVASDLFGNLLSGSGTNVIRNLNLPLTNYPTAATLRLRRASGEITIYEGLLFVDDDGDLLDNFQEEEQLGTSDHNTDSDGDGLGDYAEVFVYGTDPAAVDSDSDGMWDGDEVRYGRDPTAFDSYATLPFTENFEPPTVQAGYLHGQHGWETTPSNSGVVQTGLVYAGAQSLALTNPAGTEARQLFAASNQVIWLDIAQRAVGVLTPTGTPSVAASWLFNADGRLVVFDGSAGANGSWVILTNHTPLSLPQWARVIAKVDYGARKWQVYLNGARLATNLGFSVGAGARFTALTLSGKNGYADNIGVSATPPTDLDTDNDGMPDYWELAHSLNPYDASDASADPDSDGLTNLQEYQHGTDPNNPDSDGDGYTDSVEIQWGSDPNNAASFPHANLSGSLTYTGPQTGTIYVIIATNAEYSGNVQYRTLDNPTNYAFTNVPALRSYWIGGWRDADGDASNDFWEANGVSATNPVYLVSDVTNANIALADPDTDADGLPDWWEMKWFGNLAQGANDDPDGDGLTNLQEYQYGYDPTVNYVPCYTISGTLSYTGPQTGTIYIVLSTNGAISGMVDYRALSDPGAYAFSNQPVLRNYSVWSWRDANGDTTQAFWEAQGIAAGSPYFLTNDVSGADIALGDPDTDSDTLPDWWEMKWFGDLDAGPAEDPDNDGLTNLQEYQLGTDPTNPDTDGDGMTDGDEVNYGRDPLVFDSYATLPFSEDFEPPAVQAGPIHGQHGWEAVPTNGGVAQSEIVYAGSQSLALTNSAGGTVRQLFAGTNQNVWLDLHQRVAGVLTPAVGTPNAAASWVFNAEGRLLVFDGSAWITLTNHMPFAAGQWARVSAHLDYATRKWAMYLDGWLVASDLGFSSAAGDKFTALTLSGKNGHADNINVTTTQPADLTADTDNDGMPDAWELAHGLNPNVDDSGLDPDGDGLTNLQEYQHGTDPHNPDTDGDGMPDGWEVAHNLNPLVNDAGLDPDSDGLNNIQEFQNGTDPHDPDTDGDGMPDGWEVTNNLNPLVNDAAADPDGDGLSNLGEYQNGTDPHNADTDGDGMPDGWEVNYNLNPLTDDAALDPDSDGLTNLEEYQSGSDPHNADTDGDHLPDKYEVQVSLTDPANSDTDSDGLHDWWEVRFGMNPLVADSAAADPDSDGLNNGAEEALLTDPNRPDTDNDGMPDKWENDHSLNPAAGELYSLVSAWLANEAGGSDLPDAHLWNNTGSLYYGAAFTLLNGHGPNALARYFLDVSAPNAFALVPDHASLTTTNAFTLAVGILPGALTQSVDIVSKANAAGQSEFTLSYDPAAQQLQFSHKNAANQSETVAVSYALPTNAWTRLAVAVTNNQVKFFVNGAQQGATQTLTYQRSHLGDLILGPGSPYQQRPAQPLVLSNIRLYNAVLTAGELAALCEAEGDADGDGLTNLEEYEYGTDPNADDRYIDSDGDGLSNYDEIKVYGTDPFNADTDGDGVNDGDEIDAETDPLVADQESSGAMTITILFPEDGAVIL